MNNISIGKSDQQWLNIGEVKSNNTLLFDMSSNGVAVCSNLTVAQVRKVHKIMGEFLDSQPVTVTVTGRKDEIERLQKNSAFTVTNTDDW